MLSLANIYYKSVGYMVLKINAIRIPRVNIFKPTTKEKKEKNGKRKKKKRIKKYKILPFLFFAKWFRFFLIIFPIG